MLRAVAGTQHVTCHSHSTLRAAGYSSGQGGPLTLCHIISRRRAQCAVSRILGARAYQYCSSLPRCFPAYSLPDIALPRLHFWHASSLPSRPLTVTPPFRLKVRRNTKVSITAEFRSIKESAKVDTNLGFKNVRRVVGPTPVHSSTKLVRLPNTLAAVSPIRDTSKPHHNTSRACILHIPPHIRVSGKYCNQST